MRGFDHNRLWLDNRCLRCDFNHFFSRCLYIRYDGLLFLLSGGGHNLFGFGNCRCDIVSDGTVLLLNNRCFLRLVLRTRNRIANPHFTGRHFRRSTGNLQRHCGLCRVTLITVTATTLTADAQMTRRTARTTRHACGITVFCGFFLLSDVFYNSRQVQFGQFCTLYRSFRGDRFYGNTLFTCACRSITETDFLVQLTLFTTRHHLNALFLFGFLLRLFFTVQRFHILRCLAFFVAITTTITLAAGRLLLITLFRFFRLFYSHRYRLTSFTRFGILLRFLTAITAIVIAVLAPFITFCTRLTTFIAVATVTLARFAAILLALLLLFFLLFLNFGWCGSFTPGKQVFQGGDKTAKKTRSSRCCYRRLIAGSRLRLRYRGFRCRWRRRNFRHDEGRQCRLLRAFTLSRFFV